MRFLVLAAFIICSSASVFASEVVYYSATLDYAESKSHDMEVCQKIANSELLLSERTETFEDEGEDLESVRSIKDYYVQNDDIHSIFRIVYVQLRQKRQKKIDFQLTCSEFVIDRFAY